MTPRSQAPLSPPYHPITQSPYHRTSPSFPNRRDLLRVGAAALTLGVARFRWPAPAGAQEAANPAADVCVLTPEQTEGPYYLPLDLVRADITEDRPGVPLQLRIAVADVKNCTMLTDAAVDIWHCDAQGYYSGVGGNPGSGADPAEAETAATGTFLRGIQLTDADGIAEFTTIYPGWYSGRTVHIHVMVHTGGTADLLADANPEEDAGTYEGGRVVHTGQLYFDDALSDDIFTSAEPYGGRDEAERVRNDQDFILGRNAGEPGFMLALTPLVDGSPDEGFLGEITVGVDPGA